MQRATTSAAAVSPLAIPIPELKGTVSLRPATPSAPPEQWEQDQQGGRMVRNVVDPTLTPVFPDRAKATGAAVIVAPGGGFRVLMMDAEGFEVAHWLADHGVAAFVLKYRTVPMPRERAAFDAAYMGFLTHLPRGDQILSIAPPESLEDAQAAVRLVRNRAAQWGIDPHKVGFMGFSAGAMTTLNVALAGDVADRPDFIAPIYGPLISRNVAADSPPMFLAIAMDDPLFATPHLTGLIDSWRAARRPFEVHLYGRGGHGFATSKRSAASAMWLDEFLAWLKDRAIIAH